MLGLVGVLFEWGCGRACLVWPEGAPLRRALSIGCGLGPLRRLVGQRLTRRVCDKRMDSLPAATGFPVDS